MLLLHINRRAYMWSSLVRLKFDLNDLERSMSRSIIFRTFNKGADFGHMLQLDTTRKPYMGSPMTLKGQS